MALFVIRQCLKFSGKVALMASLSIVVPRLGPNVHFENTLASILRYRMPHHQVLVVQSDLQADTYGLEEEVDFVEVPGKQGLARYLNQAIPAATGQFIHILRPGIEVTHQWFSHGIRAFQNEDMGSVACSIVAASFRDEIISYGLSTGKNKMPRHITQSMQKPFGASTWAAFYRRQVLQAIGQLDEAISDEFVGLDLAFAHHRLGLRCQVITDRVVSIADEKWLRLSHRSQTGCDARRMIQRHVSRSDRSLHSTLAWTSELLTNGWRPTRWPQLWGRLSAQNKQATDRGFYRRVELAKHELAEQTPVTNRRAA